MTHFILLSSFSRTKTWILAPYSDSAWKFTSKYLFQTSFYCCYRLKQLRFVKITEIRLPEKITCFYCFQPILKRKCQFWCRIRNQRGNLPRKSFFIRHFNVDSGWNSYKMWKSLKSEFLKKLPISTVPSCSRTKTPFLTPDSESTWKFTSKILLHTVKTE